MNEVILKIHMKLLVSILYARVINEVEGGGGGGVILISPCPFCSSVDRIMSALHLQQYLLDPFPIYTSYQATSEGVSPLRSEFEFLANSLNL